MDMQFKMVKGTPVNCLDGIYEGYNIKSTDRGYIININVSAENLDLVFRSLCDKVRTPGFLLLEHGTNKNIEDKIRLSDSEPFHIDVHYLNGLKTEDFINIYNRYKELLINDGEINYGFGSHSGIDEVYVGPYKIFTIFTDEIEKYEKVLCDLGIPRVEKLKTIWENFSDKTPGFRITIQHNGIDIYKMVEQLNEEGLYLAERREG